MFKIARRVASDRIISTVDAQARHRHKTFARGFDGYSGRRRPAGRLRRCRLRLQRTHRTAGGRECLQRHQMPAANPGGVTVPIRPATGRHAGTARFAPACRACSLAAQCTTSQQGCRITIGPHEARLAAARARQHDPFWKADYRATQSKVERKIAHLMRRRHGGRRARVRGQLKVAAGFALLAAAVNLARLAVLGIACQNGTWAAAGG